MERVAHPPSGTTLGEISPLYVRSHAILALEAAELGAPQSSRMAFASLYLDLLTNNALPAPLASILDYLGEDLDGLDGREFVASAVDKHRIALWVSDAAVGMALALWKPRCRC